MNNKIKSAFNTITAEKELKDNTIEYINSKRKSVAKKSYRKAFIPALASLIIVIASCIFGFRIYNTETAIISIDVNPSIELGLNPFDKVISVVGYNEDGEELANAVDVKNMNYKAAVEKILSMDFSSDAFFSVTIAGKNKQQKEKCLYSLESVSVDDKVFIDSATEEEVSDAHKVGLSFGKYKAFKKLREYDSEITTDKIKDMTMRDIKNKIKDYEKGHKDESGSDDCSEDGFHGGKDESEDNGFHGGKDESADNGYHGGKDESADNGYHGGKDESADNGYHGGKDESADNGYHGGKDQSADNGYHGGR